MVLVMTICAMSGYSLSLGQCYRIADALTQPIGRSASFRGIQELL